MRDTVHLDRRPMRMLWAGDPWHESSMEGRCSRMRYVIIWTVAMNVAPAAWPPRAGRGNVDVQEVVRENGTERTESWNR